MSSCETLARIDSTQVSALLPPRAALDVHGGEARCLGDGKLAVVGGYKSCAPSCVCRRDVEQVKATSKVLGRVSRRELPGLCEYPIEVQRNRQQPLALKIVSKLSVDRATFLSRHQLASYEPLQRVRDLELMDRCKWNLARRSQLGIGGFRELL
jgi:hypothetical protein